jgi:predicted O-methyltransferase YrrM
MQFEVVRDAIAGIPHTSPENGKKLYQHILKTRPVEALELGFAHGVSSCYIAAALAEIGSGHLTCVDLESSGELSPTLEDLLRRLDLASYVTVVREKNSYTWFLKKEIEACTVGSATIPKYDFCFIDGAKNWTVDGLAFFLADKLLKENAWLLFDDYSWTYAGTGRDATDGITNRSLSNDAVEMPHIERIFKLLVMQHPSYANFIVEDDQWAWAHKVDSPVRKLSYKSHLSAGYVAARTMKKIRAAMRAPKVSAQ